MSRVVHFEIPADDPERAVAFYRDVFGWSITKWEGPMEYWLVGTGEGEEGINGGLCRREAPVDRVVNTIDVASIDSALEQVASHGGEVVMPKHAIPGVGFLAYIKDTEGNLFGLMESSPQ